MEDSRTVQEFQILGGGRDAMGGGIWPFLIIGGDLSPSMSMVVTALLLSDCGVLLLDVIMNIAAVIYSLHPSGWRGLRLVQKVALNLPKTCGKWTLYDPL